MTSSNYTKEEVDVLFKSVTTIYEGLSRALNKLTPMITKACEDILAIAEKANLNTKQIDDLKSVIDKLKHKDNGTVSPYAR